MDAQIALESIERTLGLENTNGHGVKTLYKPVEGGEGEKSCHAERY